MAQVLVFSATETAERRKQDRRTQPTQDNPTITSSSTLGDLLQVLAAKNPLLLIAIEEYVREYIQIHFPPA